MVNHGNLLKLCVERPEFEIQYQFISQVMIETIIRKEKKSLQLKQVIAGSILGMGRNKTLRLGGLSNAWEHIGALD